MLPIIVSENKRIIDDNLIFTEPNHKKMEWRQLLSLRRQGDTAQRLRKNQDETRLGFDVDFDRILFSSAFRSLQDKTQVMPMPVNTGSTKGFVHSRLTHSLEVSVVGRSLGRLAGQRLLSKYPELKEEGYQFNDFGAIVAAASLSHDIGNPPFGHSGEKAIGHYFSEGPGQQFKAQLSAEQYQDLIDFEGNANGFRILSESRPGIAGGLRLSYATLGAFTKYPKASLPKKPNKHIANKKFGVFQNNWVDFEEVATALGLRKQEEVASGYFRHPLTYLVEAADDICYTIIDFEDGINLGLIPEEYALEYFINLVKNRIDTDKYRKLSHTADRLAYLRALAINTLVMETVDLFMEDEEHILQGTFDKALLDKSTYSAQIGDIIKLSVEKMYRSSDVIEKELSGYEVIRELLHRYTEAAYMELKGEDGQYQDLLLSTIPPEFRSISKDKDPLYSILMNMSCFVASLSDSAAIQRHNLLTARF